MNNCHAQPKKFKNNAHPVPFHSSVSMDHTVSCEYESPYMLWPWITFYFLTMNRLVFSDNRLPCIKMVLL